MFAFACVLDFHCPEITETPNDYLHMKTLSIFKKMAAIVAIVGAGLLAAPLEQAQAQVLSPSHITGVTLECVHPSDATSGIWSISVDIDVFDTSSDYDVRVWWPGLIFFVIEENFGSSAYRTVFSPPFDFFIPPLVGDYGNYYTVKFEKNSDDCIKVVIWVGADGDVSAMGYDSDGNSYSVDVTVE